MTDWLIGNLVMFMFGALVLTILGGSCWAIAGIFGVETLIKVALTSVGMIFIWAFGVALWAILIE